MSKRPVRDGIIKRGNTWSYVIRVSDPTTGVSKPRWVGGFPSETAAKAARDGARKEARRGEYVHPVQVTVREYLTEWLETHALEVKPKTLDGYRYMINSYVLPRLGGLQLQAVRPAHLTTLYRDLLETGGQHRTGLSKRTVDYVHSILRKALNDAVITEQLLPANPALRAKRPHGRRSEIAVVWSAQQLSLFLGHAEDHRLYPFLHTAAFTGARRGELLNLRWRDVDLTIGSIAITGSVSVVAGQRVLGTTKTGRSRNVGIDASTVTVLREHRRRQDAERAVVADAWPDTDLVFRTGLGSPLYPDTISQLVPRLIRSYNCAHPSRPLPHARLHDLRHIHATTLLLAGQPVHVVAARLGHTDPSITLRVYAHVLQEHTAGLADVFARAISQNPDRG